MVEFIQVAERFEVTISALKVRLQQLWLLYMDKNGRLHESPTHAEGQISLPL